MRSARITVSFRFSSRRSRLMLSRSLCQAHPGLACSCSRLRGGHCTLVCRVRIMNGGPREICFRIAKIQSEVQEALLAIHEAEGDDETDAAAAAPEQVDCARNIQSLSKEILRRLAVAPAENLDDEDGNETLEPYELFRTS
eukprot:s468_g14.t1